MRHALVSTRDAASGVSQWLLGRRPRRASSADLIGRESSGELIRRKRLKVAVLAAALGLISAAIDMPMPAEEWLRSARATYVRSKTPPQNIVLIAIDDETLNAIGKPYPTRSNDAKLFDLVFAAGATRLGYDRAHADLEDPVDDARFIAALDRHKGKIFLGAAPSFSTPWRNAAAIQPHAQFRSHTQMALMVGRGDPFGFSVRLPTAANFGGEQLPSLSSVLAGYSGKAQWYRPDYAYNPKGVPTLSYIDVVEGRFDPADFAGNAVVVGVTGLQNPDFYMMQGRGKVPGVYFHVLGAHTLKRGLPLDVKWYPAVLVALLALAAQILSRARSRRILWLTAGGLLLAPMVLEEIGIQADVLSGALMLVGASIGFRQIARKYYSQEVDAFTTSALPLEKRHGEQDVYALKIGNLAELSEDWNATQMGEFIANLIDFIKGPGEAREVALEKDVLIWLAPRLARGVLEKHADGLAMMLKMAIAHDGYSTGSAPALGIDTHYDLALGQRIKKAIQAADEASAKGIRFVINDAAYIEARQHKMEMLRVLEKGLKERQIGVGYQPKIDLASGRIVGAEALIRWQPDGAHFVNPQELVLTAEAHDMINDLTLIVMDVALRDAREALKVDRDFKLAVNMSAKSLSDTDFLFDMMTLLGRHHFPGRNLTLELTETAKLDDAGIAAQIKALQQRHISLSIDDFGTGQSNLEYLETVPSHELKIDKRFVQGLATSEESKAIVRATIEIAHSLGKVVVAEGVEDAAIAAELRAMHCDIGQGYHFARAIRMDELVEMIRKKRAA
jgi:diguanylate cyclase